LSLDSLVGEFVAVVLNKVFEFDAGEADEGFARCEGGAQAEFFVSGQDFGAEIVHGKVSPLLVCDLVIETDDLIGELCALRFPGSGKITDLLVIGLPLLERDAQGTDFAITFVHLSVEFIDGTIRFLFGESLELFREHLAFGFQFALRGLKGGALGFGVAKL